MKKILLYLSLLATVLLVAYCTTKTQTTKKEKPKPTMASLAPESIYDYDKVYNFLFDSKDFNVDSLKAESSKLFLQAEEQYRNKKNLPAGIPLFKKSILTFPDARSYNELGNNLLDANQYEESLKAFEMAVKLGYHPLSQTYFNMASAAAAKGGEYGAMEYLERAVRHGFGDTTLLMQNPHLKKLKDVEVIWHLIVGSYYSGNDQVDPKFTGFLKNFSALEIPFDIQKENTAEYDDNNSISFEYRNYIEEMQNADFGRDVSNLFYADGILKKTPHYIAVLYKSVELYGSEVSPVYTYLVTYNNKGETISEKMFSCLCSANKVKEGSFDGEKIRVSEYNIAWRSPITEVSMDENEIVDYTEKETVFYKIDETGNIVNAETVSAKAE